MPDAIVLYRYLKETPGFVESAKSRFAKSGVFLDQGVNVYNVENNVDGSLIIAENVVV